MDEVYAVTDTLYHSVIPNLFTGCISALQSTYFQFYSWTPESAGLLYLGIDVPRLSE
jgi:hypothetical protein